MKGTLLRHPLNGTLVYSVCTWQDPNYASIGKGLQRQILPDLTRLARQCTT